MYSDSCILYLKSYHTHIQVSGLSFRVIDRKTKSQLQIEYDENLHNVSSCIQSGQKGLNIVVIIVFTIHVWFC